MSSKQVIISGKMIPKTAVVYLRVSSEEQTENYSLDNQLQYCQREAERRGYKITKVFREEGKSAKTISGRPQLLELLEFCRQNKKDIDALIAYKIDRISRETSDYLIIRKQLASYGIDVISASEPTGHSPAEKFVETLLASVAEFDNSVRAERTKAGLRSRFLAGLPIGKVPLGYKRANKQAENDPSAFDLVRQAWGLMESGSYSLKDMAKLMNSWGLRAVHRGKIHELRAQTVQRIFRDKFYMGIMTSSRYPEEITGKHDPMVTEQTYYNVQAILTGRRTFNPNIIRSYDNEDFPLRRIVKCGNCSSPLTGAWSKYHQYAYYFCPKRCGKPSILPVDRGKKHGLEDSLLRLLRKITPTQETTEKFILRLHALYNKKLEVAKKAKKEAQEQLASLGEERITLAEKNMKGIFSDEIYKEMNAKLESKIIAARAAMNDATIEKYDIEGLEAFIRSLLDDLGKAYIHSTLPQKKFLLGSIFPSGLTWHYEREFEPSLASDYELISIPDQKNALSSASGI